MLLLYVDDIILASNSMVEISKVKGALMQEFKMRDLGELSYFLGIKITRNKGTINLSQGIHLRTLLKKFKMENCAPVKTPMVLGLTHDEKSASTNGDKPYRELIGSLMYACMATRPDICAAVNHFSQFQTNPTMDHWKGLKRVLRYVEGTLDLSLCFERKSDCPLSGYADADFANGSDRKSISGYVVEVFGNSVSWCTRKQRSVALSTTEAEYVSLATASAEILWTKQLLADLKINCLGSIPVHEDNQSCIHSLKTWDQKRLKHIDVKYNFVRDLQQRKIFDIQYISTENQKADILTKPLAPDVFKRHRNALGMR